MQRNVASVLLQMMALIATSSSCLPTSTDGGGADGNDVADAATVADGGEQGDASVTDDAANYDADASVAECVESLTGFRFETLEPEYENIPPPGLSFQLLSLTYHESPTGYRTGELLLGRDNATLSVIFPAPLDVVPAFPPIGSMATVTSATCDAPAEERHVKIVDELNGVILEGGRPNCTPCAGAPAACEGWSLLREWTGSSSIGFAVDGEPTLSPGCTERGTLDGEHFMMFAVPWSFPNGGLFAVESSDP